MKLFKKIRKGFTLIELVVVIAIIAILAAVSIVSYISITNKAKESNDHMVIDQVNTLVQGTSYQSRKATVHDLVEELVKEDGFDMREIKPELKDTEFVYCYEENMFGYWKNNKVVYPESLVKKFKDGDFDTNDVWKFEKDPNPEGGVVSFGDNYSHYIKSLKEGTTSISVKGGLDVGNSSVSSINFSRSSGAKKDVVIRTNGGTLTIGSSTTVAEGRIIHYGILDEAIVYTTNNSFHTHGKISSMDLKAGKAVAEDKGYVALVKASEGTVVEEKDTGVFYIPADATTATINADVAANIGYTVTSEGTTASVAKQEKIASTDYEIANKNDLIAFRDAWNLGNLPAGTTYKIVNDIDMSGYYWVTPIGTLDRPFIGTFDGQNHKVDNLSNAGHKTTEIFTNATSGSQGAIFGLFGYVIGESTIENVEVDVNAAYSSGNCWAGIVAASADATLSTTSNLIMRNVTVRGNLSANSKVAGLIGQAAPYSNTSGSIKLYNCNNYANVTASKDRGSGLIGAIGSIDSTTAVDIVLDNCHNHGTISVGNYGAGLIGNLNNSAGMNYSITNRNITRESYTINNCSNTGTITSVKSSFTAFTLVYDLDNGYDSKTKQYLPGRTLQRYYNCKGDYVGSITEAMTSLGINNDSTQQDINRAYWRTQDSSRYVLRNIAYSLTDEERSEMKFEVLYEDGNYSQSFFFKSFTELQTAVDYSGASRARLNPAKATVKLLSDFSTSDAKAFANILIIDLNGHNLTFNGSDLNDAYQINSLTIKNSGTTGGVTGHIITTSGNYTLKLVDKNGNEIFSFNASTTPDEPVIGTGYAMAAGNGQASGGRLYRGVDFDYTFGN